MCNKHVFWDWVGFTFFWEKVGYVKAEIYSAWTNEASYNFSCISLRTERECFEVLKAFQTGKKMVNSKITKKIFFWKSKMITYFFGSRWKNVRFVLLNIFSNVYIWLNPKKVSSVQYNKIPNWAKRCCIAYNFLILFTCKNCTYQKLAIIFGRNRTFFVNFQIINKIRRY